MNITELLKEKKATVVDVRTTDEYRGGHVAGSVNIPLNELPDRFEEIKTLKAPLILCCAAGGRSSVATKMLTQQGVECINGGSWLEVNFHQSQI